MNRYLRELIPYLVTSVLFIAAGTYLGIITTIYIPTTADAVRAGIGEFAKMFFGLPRLHLALAIFGNNAVKVLTVIIFGILFGVWPVLFLLLNGYVLGMVIYLSVASEGTLASVLGILPHGLFELPAVLLGTSIGLRLGTRAAGRLFGRREASLTGELLRALKFFFLVIVPLLLLAAFIEAFVTPSVYSWFSLRA